MIALGDAEFLRGTTVRYDWKALPWEESFSEDAIILYAGKERVRILHLNTPDKGDVTKWVDPKNLYEISES